MHHLEIRADHLVEPHFKGIVDVREPQYIGLLTGRTIDGQRLSVQALLDLVEQCPSIELVTDVRRALMAIGFAAHAKGKGKSRGPRLYSPEGCMHRIGPYAYRGVLIFGEMWQGDLVPEIVREDLPPPLMIDCSSDCTSREVRRTIKRLTDEGRADVITDAYQKPRSEEYFARMKKTTQTVTVYTPEQLQPLLSESPHIPSSFARFIDAVHAIVADRFAAEDVPGREEQAEKKYKLLHRASAVCRVLHLPDPERWLASVLRSDTRLRKVLFPVPEEPLYPGVGFPPKERD